MVLVDSSVWIEAARRDGDIGFKVALEALLEEYEATLCSPVRLEVLGGARKNERLLLEECLAVLPYAAVSEETWTLAVRHSWRLRDAGITVPWNDLLIATLSIQLGCRLFARDEHFERMQPLMTLRLYAPGYGGSFAPDSLPSAPV